MEKIRQENYRRTKIFTIKCFLYEQVYFHSFQNFYSVIVPEPSDELLELIAKGPKIGQFGELLHEDDSQVLQSHENLTAPDGRPLLGKFGEILGKDGKAVVKKHGEILAADGSPLLGKMGQLRGTDGESLLGKFGQIIDKEGESILGKKKEIIGKI